MNRPPTKSELRNPWKRWFHIAAILWSFGTRHRRWFVSGAISALGVVGLRLILPWPLKALIEPSLKKAVTKSHGLLLLVPDGWNPAITMGAVFLGAILFLGLFDYIERLCFARFSIGAIRDLRAKAFRKARQIGGLQDASGSGDLVARLIGDTARLKAGLKGFLVHVATNGVNFIGLTLIVLWINTTMGLIFVVTIFLIGLVTLLGARSMYARALKFRTKEGKLADFIQDSWDNQTLTDFAAVNESSGHHEAALTQIQGRTTWCAHVIFGIGIVATIGYGARAVAGKSVDAGDLVVLAMYALSIRKPIVQLARQGTRTGKILACGDRLARLLTSSGDSCSSTLAPLRNSIRLRGVRVTARRAKKNIRRLGPIDLNIGAGKHIVVLGKPGSGKSTLLELLAGTQPLRAGTMYWDAVDVSSDPAQLQSSGETSLLPVAPSWAPRRIRELLGTKEGRISDVTRKVLRGCGATSLLERLPENVDTKIESATLSARERVAVALVVMLRGTSSVWLLDDPVSTLEKNNANKVLKKLLKARADTTVVVTMSRPVAMKKFDRVIEMRRGRILFDGTPAQWKTDCQRRAIEKEAKSNPSSAVSQS